QEDVDVLYKSPAAIGAGLRYRFDNWKLHLSAEYYAKVSEWNIMELDSFVSNTGESFGAVLRERYEEVLNWGVGFEYTLQGRWSAYGSFITDRSAAPADVDDRASNSVTSWDIYHIAGGGVLRLKRTEITIGATYGFGSEDVNQPVDLNNAGEGNGLQGEEKPTRVDYSAFKIIFGFSVSL
ncbi:MAG: hypothetical protein V3V75_03960, partial [Thermoguttaceae bacterium]